MRTIHIEAIDWGGVVGARLIVPVRVDWPELRLSEGEVVANAIAAAAGQPAPFPNRSVIEVVIERPLYLGWPD